MYPNSLRDIRYLSVVVVVVVGVVVSVKLALAADDDGASVVVVGGSGICKSSDKQKLGYIKKWARKKKLKRKGEGSGKKFVWSKLNIVGG